ncbi:hypothetical protein D3C80_1393530 [compost metagenome]
MFADIVHFGFKADQHVAQATFDKGRRCTTATGIKHHHVFQQTGHELTGLGLIVAISLAGSAPGGQIGVAAITGGFRVREYQLHVITHQIAPGVDAFRVVLAHQERHGGIEWRTVVRQALLPICRDQLAAIVQDLHVTDLVIGDHIGTQTLQDCQRLFRRTGVGLFDGQFVVRMLLIPLLFKARVQRGKQFAGDVIRAVEQFCRRSRTAG